MASEAPKLTPKAKRAVEKLQSVEDKLLAAQTAIPNAIREVQDVKAMFIGAEEEASDADPA